jgi:nucleoside-diphosphate-sugar epimerase
MPPLVVVLGASGYIGSAVTAALATRPIRLRAVGRTTPAIPDNATADITTHTADLTDPESVAAAVKDADAVMHLVARTSGWREPGAEAQGERVNVGVMKDVLAALGEQAGKPIVIYAGSTSQVGLPPTTRLDGTEPDHPETPFDRQKLAAERLLLAEDGIRGISLRMPTAYGHSPTTGSVGNGVLTFMARRALAGEQITMWHDGTVRRDLLHVSDAAAAFVAALDHADALSGRFWLVGTGVGTPLGDVFRTISGLAAQHTGNGPVPVVSVPPPGAVSEADLRSVSVDATPFRTLTGWRPAADLTEALRATVAAA